FYCFDGNGNVVGLVNSANGLVVAIYEYGPFGELIRASGPLAFINPFRFSSKYQDDETGWLYYGYRYYDARLGRWLSRDPLEEQGGANLLVFSGNDGLDFFDSLGLTWQIERNGGNRAHAKAGKGDTVSALAKIVGFDDKDYSKWLKPVGPTKMPRSAGEAIAGCAEFTIPNTI